MEAFHYRNLKIFYKKVGSGKPIIFLHNGGNSHVIWDHQLDYFSRTHTCYAFDLPGYGQSVNAEAVYPLELYINFLDAFIEQEKLAPVTLVGNCVGSATSLSYTMRKPENVDKLILFNILTKKTVWDGLWGIFFKLTEPAPAIRPRLHAAFGKFVPPGVIASFAVATQFGNRGTRDPRLVSQLKKNYKNKGQLGALMCILSDIESFIPMDHFEIPQKFPPTLVIWGEKNRILPVGPGKVLCATLKPHKLEIIKGGGHVVMHELHQEINPLIAAHLGI